ncbi:MAG: sugar ABC transporter substrate-binding protein [Spirochaetales bacterium]|nr:sugar ABC transporter substrate-binding protein [Spirochaetales bacterium]
MRRISSMALAVSVFLLASLVFAGGAAEGTVDDVVRLTFRQSDPPGEIEGLEQAVADWNARNPDIQVRIESVPWSDALNQFVREGQASGGPDVLQIAFVWTADLARAGLLMNLDEMIEREPPGAGIDDFLGTDLGIVEDSYYGIPWTVDTFVMAYRPDLFAAAGIERFPEEWGEFHETVGRLTQDIDGDGRIDRYGFGFPAGSASGGGMWFLVNYYLWSNGDTFVERDPDGEWTVGVSASTLAEIMQYYNRFFNEGATPMSLIGVNSWGDPELTGGLARGDFAIGFFPPSTFRAAQSQSSVDLATAMIPRGRTRRVSHLGGRTLAINQNTTHPAEAWEFLRYLTSRGVFERYRHFPAQQTLLSQLEFPPSETGYADQLPHAITFKQYIDSPAPVSAMWDATNREFASVFSGQKTPEQASRDLLATIEVLLMAR